MLVMSSVGWGQQLSHRLTNQDIIDMTALGLSDDIIITKIHSARPEDLAFDTSTEGLKKLKAGKVSIDQVPDELIPDRCVPGSLPERISRESSHQFRR